jgi:hypothetical protein
MLDVPPRCTEMLFDASVDLFFTEREVEARRALQRGLAKGVADGAFLFEPDSTRRIRRLDAAVVRTRDLSAQPRSRTRDIQVAR